ncbi:MAG TPA: hypothetical protein VJU80_08990 [Solirubrobacteraceae bacterium]|nr:hypothetical protein [Solirubrobacteraceae bacterium]
MNEHEIERIAESMNRLRPDWPVRQLKTLLSDERMVNRPRRDVSVALAWVACESGSSSPYRVLENGPWWKAVAIEGTTATYERFDPNVNCSTCSLPQDRCRRLWADDHPFVSTADYEKKAIRDPERIRRILEAVRGEKTPMREPSQADPVEEHRIDHADCDAEIDKAIAAGKTGRAEYLSMRCDREHNDAAEDARRAGIERMRLAEQAAREAETESTEEMA